MRFRPAWAALESFWRWSYGIQPDVITAKGWEDFHWGSALWGKTKDVLGKETMVPPLGNPVCCAGARAVLEMMDDAFLSASPKPATTCASGWKPCRGLWKFRARA